MSLKHKLLAVFVTTAVLAMASAPLAAQSYLSSDRFGYTGTIERYTTFADLLAGTNAVTGSPFTIPARDLGLYFVDHNAAFASPYASFESIFLSNWYANNGQTPSNQNYGFIQMYDDDGGTVQSMFGQWINMSRTDYRMTVSGSNPVASCTSPGDCGRLWNAGSTLGSGETTAGLFQSYLVDITATGLTPATWNSTTGVYESVSDPTAVSGSIDFVFQNTSVQDPSSNGWYKGHLDVDMNNWAYTNGYVTPGSSYFGSPTVTPEPVSLTLVGTGMIGIVAALRRRKRRDLPVA